MREAGHAGVEEPSTVGCLLASLPQFLYHCCPSFSPFPSLFPPHCGRLFLFERSSLSHLSPTFFQQKSVTARQERPKRASAPEQRLGSTGMSRTAFSHVLLVSCVVFGANRHGFRKFAPALFES
jgi:hypothetical protein